MLFNSFEFLLFYIIVSVLFFIINNKWRWLLLLIASYVFYSSWSISYLGLIIISTLVTYYSGILLDKQNSNLDKSENTRNKNKHRIVATSLIINLGILFFFKYYNFAATSANSLIPNSLPFIDSLLPVVGISFYTFQALSYTMDVYNGKIKAKRHIGKYALFVSFFPQLVAGPIEKAANLLPQFDEHKTFDYQKVRSGVLLMVWGVFKKVVVADRLGIFVSKVYDSPESTSGIIPVIATLFFAIQLYIDFSSYSDIAIGAARVFGYKLTINFKRPYLSTSFGNFWKRWHISLNSWFMEYLYIPLGGNRGKYSRTIINIIIVFLISGLWHGASWNFVIWGAVNAFYLLVLDRYLFTTKSKRPLSLLKKIFRGTVIMLFWSLSLVFFRANNFTDAITIYSNLSFTGIDQLYDFGLNELTFKFALGMFFFIYVIELFQEVGYTPDNIFRAPLIVRWSIYLLLPLAIIYFGAYGSKLTDSSFIYFQF